jgi:hypothetical protein
MFLMIVFWLFSLFVLCHQQEAERHELSEYLAAAVHLSSLSGVISPSNRLQIFLATDDPSVLEEAKEFYRLRPCVGEMLMTMLLLR